MDGWGWHERGDGWVSGVVLGVMGDAGCFVVMYGGKVGVSALRLVDLGVIWFQY